MIPLYTKAAIIGVGALAAIGGIMFLQKKTAPAALPVAPPATKPASSSLFASTAGTPASPVTPSGQTQAQIDAINAQSDAQLAAFLDQELASF